MKIKLISLFLIILTLSSALSGCIVYTKQMPLSENAITKDEAVDIAIDFFGLDPEDCKTIRAELDDEVYEVELICGTSKYEAEVTVFNGHVSSNRIIHGDDGSFTVSDTTGEESMISSEEAKELAALALDLDSALCTFTSVELDDGYYEIEFFYNNVEYDVKVHSRTGLVTEIEND